MYKKKYSIIVIILTIAYVIFGIEFNHIDVRKIISINIIVRDIQKIKIVKLLSFDKSSKVIYNEVNQSSEVSLKTAEDVNGEQTPDKAADTYKNQLISDTDMEKLISVAKKLAPIDQIKVNTYLESKNKDDISQAINLLRGRLSDKEFESIKLISSKYGKN